MRTDIPSDVPSECPSCCQPNATYTWYHYHLRCTNCGKDPRTLTKDGVRRLIEWLKWDEPSHKTSGPAIEVCEDWLRRHERSG